MANANHMEAGDRVSTSPGNMMTIPEDKNPVYQSESPECSLQFASKCYVLSAPPILDDLLEGGTSSGRQSTQSKIDSAPKTEYLNELLREKKKLKILNEFHHLRSVSCSN